MMMLTCAAIAKATRAASRDAAAVLIGIASKEVA